MIKISPLEHLNQLKFPPYINLSNDSMKELQALKGNIARIKLSSKTTDFPKSDIVIEARDFIDSFIKEETAALKRRYNLRVRIDFAKKLKSINDRLADVEPKTENVVDLAQDYDKQEELQRIIKRLSKELSSSSKPKSNVDNIKMNACSQNGYPKHAAENSKRWLLSAKE